MPNIELMGATYPDVPAVELPMSGGGTALFHDVTDTTAEAEDVASGKLFHASDGTLTVGTSSGGAIIPVVMRPDAELVQRWAGDEKVVEDLELTLPEYKTSAQTIKTGAALSPVISMDLTYRYYVAYFCLSEPIYSTDTKVKGRCEYGASAFLYEIAVIPANTIKTLDGSKAFASRQIVNQANGSIGRELYWSSATAIAVNNAVTYGTYVSGQAPTISSTNLTVKAPIYGIRGNTTYMTSGAWSSMTDIREQYIVEVWRAPAENSAGWGLATGMLDILADVANGGTLER